MNVASYIWQINYDYPGANADDHALPISEVWFKTHDGISWMGNVYNHPAAPISKESVAHLTRVYRAQGIKFVPWCVPTGQDINREADLAAQVLEGMVSAGADPVLVLNVESDSTTYFWKGTPDQLRQLCSLIRARVPKAYLILAHYQFEEIGFAHVADMFDAYSTEDYWNDFKTSPENRLQWSLDRLAPYGKPIIWGLPGNAPADEMARALAWIASRGGRAAIWRRGTTGADVWQTIQNYSSAVVSVPDEPAPTPTEPAPSAPTAGDQTVMLRFRMERAAECLAGDFMAARESINKLVDDLGGVQAPAAFAASSARGIVGFAPMLGAPTPGIIPEKPKPTLREQLPHPVAVAGVGVALAALNGVFDAVNSGTVHLPQTAITAALVGALPLIIGLLRKKQAVA